ncbi:MAG: hypothetical protein EHM45_05620 [Desulfobacteraceae bacterium]|nr:MAG: hypothetical protein EHM45_05620 [Desulfobacteraceae bacterium]
MQFLADAMLGKLAKWLRVMGQDCHYQSFNRPAEWEALLKEKRTLLTRHVRSFESHRDQAVFIHSDHVAEQLRELKTTGVIAASASPNWFSRCLICNTPLEKIESDAAQEFVPEYVLHSVENGFSFCPVCRRFFWPGSHRRTMEKQLREWGFPIKAG